METRKVIRDVMRESPAEKVPAEKVSIAVVSSVVQYAEAEGCSGI